jgi:hypothetical protein
MAEGRKLVAVGFIDRNGKAIITKGAINGS